MAPIVVPHDSNWRSAFAEEAQAIKAALGDGVIALHHIGSTAIPDILAKPIIDVLGVVSRFDDFGAKSVGLVRIGYEAISAYGIEGRRYFRKNHRSGARTHHFHIFEKSSAQIERHLAFREYLLSHPEEAAAYSDLKAQLSEAFPSDRKAYAEGKAPFVAATEEKALIWYREKQGERIDDLY